MTATGTTTRLHDTWEARVQIGRDMRDAVPLEAHAEVNLGDDRPDPVGILTSQDTTRLQELVPIRHGRMNVSAFTFYRGGAAIMASDLSRGPSTDLRTQLCGDAHLANFGLFNGADRRLVFDLNDFDETCPGPFEWDLKRLVASVTIAGRNSDVSEKKIRKATRAAARTYRSTIDRATQMSPLDLHYLRIEVESLLAMRSEKKVRDKQARARSQATVKKAKRKTSMRALKKLTEEVDGARRIVSDPPVVVRVDETVEPDERERFVEFYRRYLATLPPHRAAVLERYEVVDVAHKVVGVGSVGTRCLILLLESHRGAPLFLQFKEATASVLEPYVGGAGFDQAGERVVRGQRLMQSTGDILLGWSRYHRDGQAVDFYFRQLWDGKGSIDVDDFDPKRLKDYAGHCGGTLALAHARAGDSAQIMGYLGDDETFDHVLADFAASYADLNEHDHRAHTEAIRDGRIAAVENE